MTERDVRDLLNQIQDPCSRAMGVPAGLDDMGLVRHVEVVGTPEGAQVRVTIAVTEPGCLMGAPFASEAARRLSAHPDVSRVEVSIDPAVVWSPDDMSRDYRRRLEQHRAETRRRLLPVLPG